MTLDEYDPETGEPTGVLGRPTSPSAETGRRLRLRAAGEQADGPRDRLDRGRRRHARRRRSARSTSIRASMAITRSKEIDQPVERAEAHRQGARPTTSRRERSRSGSAPRRRPRPEARRSPSEAGYPCMVVEDFDEHRSIEIPVEHTVWYTVTGTGGSITVDTAGSDFDTVIAVYEGAPDESATVACVDDTPIQPIGRTHAGRRRPSRPSPAPPTGSRSAGSTKRSSAATRTCPTATSGSPSASRSAEHAERRRASSVRGAIVATSGRDSGPMARRARRRTTLRRASGATTIGWARPQPRRLRAPGRIT